VSGPTYAFEAEQCEYLVYRIDEGLGVVLEGVLGYHLNLISI